MRKTIIELTWFWLRHQPDSALSRWFRGRVGAAKGRVRRIAIVALARKLIGIGDASRHRPSHTTRHTDPYRAVRLS